MILVKTQDTEDGAGNDPTRQNTTDRIQRLGTMKQQDRRQLRSRVRKGPRAHNIVALIIRIGFWGIVYYN